MSTPLLHTSTQNSIYNELGQVNADFTIHAKAEHLLITRDMYDPSLLFHISRQNSTYKVTSEESLKETLCGEYGEWFSQSCHSPWLPFIPPGQRKIFYGPPNNFTAGVATHLADKLGITRRGKCLEMHSPSAPFLTNRNSVF